MTLAIEDGQKQQFETNPQIKIAAQRDERLTSSRCRPLLTLDILTDGEGGARLGYRICRRS